MFNKAVLDQLKFPYPMFLTTWHMTLATILTQLLSKTTKMLPGVTEVNNKNNITVIEAANSNNDYFINNPICHVE